MAARHRYGSRRFLGLAGLVLSAALPTVLPAASASAATVGATTPFTSYEAEAGTLGGGASVVALTASPTTRYSSPQLEASGHAYVQLTGTGQSVTWTNNTGQPVSFVNLRVSMPDTPTGGGTTSTIDLYVNGAFRQALPVNSKQTWLYEKSDNSNYNQSSQNPADGNPRVAWDDTHAFLSGAAVPAGGTITIQKDSANSAANYLVDVIDVENPPAPLAQPANSISITSCGAVADNAVTNGAADSGATDSTAAIQNCINQAQSQGKILWIPQGTFYLKGTQGLRAQGITIAGAGMWYSRIYRAVPLPNSTPLAAIFSVTSCTVQDFAMDSNETSREMVDGGGGALDTNGTNWVNQRLWTQHTLSSMWAAGTGGRASDNRFLSIWADGLNLNNVANGDSVGDHLSATNNFIRGTGDDGMAINSVNYNTNADGSKTYYTPMNAITMSNNTVIGAWGGKGLGIYGGGGHQVTNNYISDTARYIGLGVGKFGVNGSDLTSATVTGNMIVRAGGNGYDQGQPALHIGNGGDGQSSGNVGGATVSNNTIVNSLYDGVGFSTSTNDTLSNNTITNPGRNGIVIQPPYYPAPTGSATITGNTVTGLKSGMSPYINNSSGFTATVTGNSWQGASAVVSASPTSLSFTSTAVGTSSSPQTVTVSNTGSAAASISGVSTTAGFSQTNNCGTSLAAGASCQVSVTFTPTASGTTNGTLTVNGSNPVSVSLSGTVSGGTTGCGSTNLAAGKPGTASSVNGSFGVGNAFDADANTYWESTNNVFPQWLQVDLGSAQSVCKVVLKLPASWGQRTQTLSVLTSNDNAAFTTVVASAGYSFDPATANSVTIALPANTSARYVRVNVTANTGWPAAQVSDFQVIAGNSGGGGSATLAANPGSLTFASTTVGSSSGTQNVTVSNSGTVAASVSSVATSGDFSQTNTCGTSIAAGASCTVTVTFRPTASGTRTGTLTVTSNATNPTLSVGLTGTGAPSGSATLAANPGSLTFASTTVGSSSGTQNVTVSNTGTVAASVSSVATSGDFSQTNTCGTSIAAGASCTVTVTFRPTASGTRTGTLTVTSNATNPTLSVGLSGTGATSTGNLATGKSMSTSGYTQVYAPANANDGNQGTYWEGTANVWPDWLQVDLGSSQTVGRVALKLPTTWGSRTQTLSVSGSTDGSTFTTLKASASYAFNPSANTVTITFTGASERYVRVTFTANSGATGGQVSELEVYAS
jgi:hypothetical protein